MVLVSNESTKLITLSITVIIVVKFFLIQNSFWVPGMTDNAPDPLNEESFISNKMSNDKIEKDAGATQT